MMARTQISLDSEIQKRARKRAAELGVSLAQYVRNLIARDLGAPEPKVGVSAIFDLGKSNGGDIARDKDRMIGEAVASIRTRRTRRGSR